MVAWYRRSLSPAAIVESFPMQPWNENQRLCVTNTLLLRAADRD